MDDDIKKILELQDVDNKIMEINQQVLFLPEELKNLKNSLEQKQKEVKEKEKIHTNIKVERRQQETELKAIEDQVKSLQKKQNEVKTNKEYTALHDEIENLKKKISLIEDTILNLMESDEKLTGQEKIFSLKTESDRKIVEEKEKEINQKIAELNKILEEKRKERELLLKNVNPEIFSVYDEIRKNKKNGIAIVHVLTENNGSICTGCNVYIASYLVEKIKKSKELVQCENCGRILYIS
ncbi:MAG: C4-type zinc ribbon domain-containing protein [Actinobacteria bacterium]|nr:C4-type zinc ribbon domain-containing protein [Actinomycetota bacterium]